MFLALLVFFVIQVNLLLTKSCCSVSFSKVYLLGILSIGSRFYADAGLHQCLDSLTFYFWDLDLLLSGS